MPVTIKTKVGQNEITVSGDDDKDLIKKISFWGQLPKKCGNCESDAIGFGHADRSGFDFYFMKCSSCQYEFKFGQKKDHSGLFPKSNKWEAPFASSGNDEEYTPPARPAPRPAPRPASRPAPVARNSQVVDDDDDDIIPM